MSRLKVPSGFAYHPSYAGVTLAPRSRGGSSGRVVCGRCALAATAQLAPRARLAATAQRRCRMNTAVLPSARWQGPFILPVEARQTGTSWNQVVGRLQEADGDLPLRLPPWHLAGSTAQSR